jgi:hypothetical protein
MFTVILVWAKLVRNGRIRAVDVRPQKFRANFSQFGRISSIAQPKNLLIWGNIAQIERNSPEIFGAKLNCAGSPISGEENNYCVVVLVLLSINSNRLVDLFELHPKKITLNKFKSNILVKSFAIDEFQ